MARKQKAVEGKADTGANLGFEAKLWAAAATHLKRLGYGR